MTRRFLLSSVLVLAFLLLPGASALAASTWFVDGVNGSDTNDCKTPQTACKTIGHAIALAASGDTIDVAAATYPENLTVPFSLAIKGAGAATTIIDGGGLNAAVRIPQASSKVVLAGVTIQNGSVSCAGPACTAGGGGVANAGTLRIVNSAIRGNGATCSGMSCNVKGGGIFNGGTLTISQTTLSGNSTNGSGGCNLGPCGGGGGGVYNAGTLTMSKSILRGNSAAGGPNGGGIDNAGALTIDGSALSGNSASGTFFGGGVGGGIENTGMLTIDRTTLSGNSASGGNGGGIDNGSAGTVTIAGSTLSGNNVSCFGPGICGAGGGGAANFGTLAISDSTISGNRINASLGFGGGVDNVGGTLTIASSTLGGNTAGAGGNGGGIYNASAATLQDTIVADSSGGGNCSGSITSNGYNLSSDGTCNLAGPGDLNNTDPKLGPLQSNGGPTQTQALLVGSPAIDAGNPAGCTDATGKLLTTDQRGFPRPDAEDAGVGCDIGAYERQQD